MSLVQGDVGHHDLQLEIKDAAKEVRNGQRALRKLAFSRVPGASSDADVYHAYGNLPPGVVSDGHRWRIEKLSNKGMSLVGGGAVVGQVPQGLPSLKAPSVDMDVIPTLLSAALVISLVGFMESFKKAN